MRRGLRMVCSKYPVPYRQMPVHTRCPDSPDGGAEREGIMSLMDCTALELADKIKRREYTCQEAVQEVFAEIEKKKTVIIAISVWIKKRPCKGQRRYRMP